MSIYGLIRFDVEDFITPESDEGLAAVLAAMSEFDMPASYGIVGKKVQSLKQHRREDLLAILAQKRSVGFHSWSHSEHPTLSEDLADRPYDEGVARFISREQPGVRLVSELVAPPGYFTQPGGNWVPQACGALPQMNMPVFFSDAWNSYLVTSSQPMWIEDILHLALPVMTPKPFAMNLPDNLEESVEFLKRGAQTLNPQQAFMIMVHPTELVSTKFWDAVNFSYGATSSTLRPAPLRSAGDREQAAQAFRTYIQDIRQIPGIEWLDVQGLVSRLVPLASPLLPDVRLLCEEVGRKGLGPLTVAGENFSAAEVVAATAAWIAGTGRPGTPLPRAKAPKDWDGDEQQRTGPIHLGEEAVMQGAQQIMAVLGQTGSLPGHVHLGDGDLAVQHWAESALLRLSAGKVGAALPLAFLSYVKSPDELHWDWPIFPPDFRPVGLWRETRRLAWSLKFSQYRD